MENFYITLSGKGAGANHILTTLDRPIELKGAWSLSMIDFAYRSATSYLKFATRLEQLKEEPDENYSFIGAQINHGSIMYDVLDNGSSLYRLQIGNGKTVHRGRTLHERTIELEPAEAPIAIKIANGQYPSRVHVAQAVVDAVRSNTVISENFDAYVTDRGEFGLKLISLDEDIHARGRFDGRQFIFAGPVVNILGLTPNVSTQGVETPILVSNVCIGKSPAFYDVDTVNSSTANYVPYRDYERIPSSTTETGQLTTFYNIHSTETNHFIEDNYPDTVPHRETQLDLIETITIPTPTPGGTTPSPQPNDGLDYRLWMLGHDHRDMIQNALVSGDIDDVRDHESESEDIHETLEPGETGFDPDAPITYCTVDGYYSGDNRYYCGHNDAVDSWVKIFNKWDKAIVRILEKNRSDTSAAFSASNKKKVRVGLYYDNGGALTNKAKYTQTYNYKADFTTYLTGDANPHPQDETYKGDTYKAYYYKLCDVLSIPAGVDVYTFNKLEASNGIQAYPELYPSSYAGRPRIQTGYQIGGSVQTQATLINATDFGFVYCDLAQPSWVGNVLVSLVGIVPINQGEAKSIKLGSSEGKRKHFVSNSRFQQIECVIATSRGTFFEFNPGSEVYITLQFTKEASQKVQSTHGL